MKIVTSFFILLTFIGLPLIAQQVRGTKSKGLITTTGQTWAVVVGISDYVYIDQLQYAHRDAEAFYQFLLSPAGGYVPQVNVTLLTNEKATTAQIVKALNNLTDLVKPGDRVILYFAGHGDQETRTIAQRGFLLTYDTYNTNYMAGALAVIFFQDYIATLSTKNKANVTVFLDACRAGKLAGNEYGGVQLTGLQLAEKAGNEAKLMACQTGEISLEGKQWGNGHGAFTYYLIRGLQGLADGNNDGEITLREVERYLEDHVTPEAVPIKQTPFKVGDAGAVLAKVDKPTLLALKNNQPLPSFEPVAGRGIVDDMLAKADSQTVTLYRSFEKCLAQKVAQQAIPYYEQLIQRPSITKAYPFLTRDMAAALIDESQVNLNNYLEFIDQEDLSAEDYGRFSKQLSYAAKILGSRSAFYRPLLGRSAYFSGVKAKMDKDSLGTFQALFRAIAYDSTAAFVYNELGTYYVDIGKWDEAKNAYNKGLKFAPNWFNLHYNIGLLHYRTGNTAKAEAAYRRAIEVKPNFVVAYNNLAGLLSDVGRKDEAEVLYKKAIQLKPDYIAPHNNLGKLLRELKRPIEAEEILRKGIELCPDSLKKLKATIYNNLGNVLRGQKRSLEANESYQIALTYNPNYAESYNNQIILLVELKQVQEAEIAYQKLINLKPEMQIFSTFQLNNLHSLIDNFKKEEPYRNAVELKPNDYNTLSDLCKVLTSHNKYKEAEAYWRKALEINSTGQGFRRLGLIIRLDNFFIKDTVRSSEEENAYKKAIELEPADALSYEFLGDLYNRQKRLVEAEAAYRKAIEFNPNAIDAYKKLGHLLYDQHSYKEAVIVFRRYTELKPTDKEGWHFLGSSGLFSKDDEVAWTSFEKIFQMDPKDTSASYNIACLYSLQGKTTEALAWLERSLKMGFKSFSHISRDSDLDNIRQTQAFKALINVRRQVKVDKRGENEKRQFSKLFHSNLLNYVQFGQNLQSQAHSLSISHLCRAQACFIHYQRHSATNPTTIHR